MYTLLKLLNFFYQILFLILLLLFRPAGRERILWNIRLFRSRFTRLSLQKSSFLIIICLPTTMYKYYIYVCYSKNIEENTVHNWITINLLNNIYNVQQIQRSREDEIMYARIVIIMQETAAFTAGSPGGEALLRRRDVS